MAMVWWSGSYDYVRKAQELYVVEGGSVSANDQTLRQLDAAMIREETELALTANDETKLLLVTVPLKQTSS